MSHHSVCRLSFDASCFNLMHLFSTPLQLVPSRPETKPRVHGGGKRGCLLAARSGRSKVSLFCVRLSSHSSVFSLGLHLRPLAVHGVSKSSNFLGFCRANTGSLHALLSPYRHRDSASSILLCHLTYLRALLIVVAIPHILFSPLLLLSFLLI